MTDVMETEQERRPNSAEYTYEVYEELPAIQRKPGAQRKTPHNERIEQVRGDFPNGSDGKPVLIATYGNDGAGAGAAVVNLNKRFGAEGFKFNARNLPGTDRKGLFVTYTLPE